MLFILQGSTMNERLAGNDPLRTVQWRDLVPLNIWERVWELSLSAPWLLASLACYARGGCWLAVGAGCTFFFFLTGLRQSHNAQHYCLGIGRRAQDIVLLVLSVLMMMSMHAVQVTHLVHHRHCLATDDVEAAHAEEHGGEFCSAGRSSPAGWCSPPSAKAPRQNAAGSRPNSFS